MAPTHREFSRVKRVPGQLRTRVDISPSGFDRSSASATCGVCRRSDCQLHSHRAYLAHRHPIVTKTPTGKHREVDNNLKPRLLQTSYTKSYAYTRVLPSLGAGRLDGFNDLPIPGGHQLDLHQSVYNCEFCYQSRLRMEDTQPFCWKLEGSKGPPVTDWRQCFIPR